MVLSSKTLALMGAYYTFANKTRCTIFEWNWKNKTMTRTKGQVSFLLWLFCASLFWIKIIFMTIRLYQSYAYLDVTVDELCIHYYYWVLYLYAGFLQVNGFDMRNSFPLMINRFTSFNSIQKKKYFPHIKIAGVLPKDNIEAEVFNMFFIVFMNTAVTVCLFLDNPTSPMFFYSGVVNRRIVEIPSLSQVICFGLLEGYLTTFSWATILTWASTSICCASTINFWIKQLNPKYRRIHLSQPDSDIRKPDEIMNMYRKLQLLTTEYNSVCFRMTVGVKAAAFWSHLGTNYGTIRLFDKMKFQVWINCPIISICGLAIIIQLLKLLAWVNVEANDCLGMMKKGLNLIPIKGRFRRSLARRILYSLRPLKVKGYHLYHFKQSTPVTFCKELMDNTINVILTF